MFTIGLSVFGVYAVILAIDEFYFHKRLNQNPQGVGGGREALNRFMNLLMLIGCTSSVVAFEYGDKTRYIFGVFALASLALLTRQELRYSKDASNQEHGVRSVLFMFHPLMLITLGALWPFINGVNFFLSTVLPFSTHGIRSLCTGCTVVLACFSLYRLFFWNQVRGRQAVAEPQTMKTAVPNSTSTTSVKQAS